MQEKQDNLPRNLLFMIAVVTSAVAAYFLNSSLFSFLQFVFDIKVQPSYTRILNGSALWGAASFWSTFALLIYTLSFLIPSVLNVIGLVALKGRISELPRASDKAPNVTKDKFLKTMEEFKLVYAEYAVPYSAYIVEKKEKNIRKKTKFIGKGKSQPKNKLEVSVLMPASNIFKLEKVLNSRLSVWFMRPLPRVLMGIGFLLFILSFAGALQSNAESLMVSDIFLMGVSSFAVCMGVGVVLMALFRIVTGHVYHRASEIVKMIESLFDHKPDDSQETEFNAVEVALNKTVSSFKDVSKAINEKQEEAVNNLIVKTLEGYVEKLSVITDKQVKTLQKVVDDAAQQSADVTKDLSKRFDDYASKISDTHNKLDKYQDKSFKSIADKMERLITSLNDEVVKATEAAINKDNILDDLNKTATDLSAISQASDKSAEKFENVAEGLDRLIVQLEKIAPMSMEKKNEISSNIESLKKGSSKTVGMRRRAAATPKAKKT